MKKQISKNPAENAICLGKEPMLIDAPKTLFIQRRSRQFQPLACTENFEFAFTHNHNEQDNEEQTAGIR